MTARHEVIADELRKAIDREEYTVGSLLDRKSTRLNSSHI